MKKTPIVIVLGIVAAVGLVGCGYLLKTITTVNDTKPSSSSLAGTSNSSSLPSYSSLSSVSSVSSAPSSSSVQAVTLYTVSFKNYDETLLSESVVEKGQTAVYDGPTPTRGETSEYTYTFSGWDKPLENITGNCVRVAQYTETLKPVAPRYTVSFKNYDGTVLYEVIVEEGGSATYVGDTPIRPETPECSYTFSGWNQSSDNVTSDIVLIAQYAETLKPVTPRYTVTFKNYDGTVLHETIVEEGKNATYSGSTPTRPDTPEFTFAFTGWDKPLDNVTSDRVLVAQYSQTNKEYTVKFYSYDNQLLYTDTVYYLQTASYYGPVPTRPDTVSHHYTFKGWDKDLTSITKSIDVRPIFDAFGNTVTLTLNPNNGETSSEINVTFGENYNLATPSLYGFEFLGWYSGATQIPSSGTWDYAGVTSVSAKWGNSYFEFTSNGDDTYTISLTAKGKNISELVIPSTYEGFRITALADNFLKQNTVIEKITIPGTIKAIPAYSFDNCTKLKEVVLEEGIETIGSCAFEGCKISKLKIPSTCKTIESYAFYNNTQLYQVYIPSSVTTIGSTAFGTLNGLAYICIEHESIPSNWNSNWSTYTTYTNTVKIVETEDYTYVVRSYYGDLSVTLLRLGEATSKLQNYVVPNEIEGISNIRLGQYLYYKNKYIRSIDLSSVSRIGSNAFYECTNLESVTFSNSLTTIGSSAFRYCSALTSVVIPDSVTEIQSMAFDACTNLTYVYIPSSVTTIGGYAFDLCNKATFYTNAHSANSGWASNFKNSQPIYYDFVSLNETEDFDYTVQSYMGEQYVTLIRIKAAAKTKKNIVIPDTIENISNIHLAERFFGEQTQLVSIDLGAGVTKIPDSCFYNCTGLETVILHEGVTSIGKNAFYNCNKLSSINMPSSLTSIGYCAFDYCSSLKEIVIPIGVTTIGNYAFDDSGLQAILIEASVAQPNWSSNWYGQSTSLKQFVYDYVSSGVVGDFRYVKTSNGVADAIYILGLVNDCTNVHLVVPDQIEGISNIKIASYAFYNNSIVKTIDLGSSVTYIGTYAFKQDSSLISVIIPASCTVIKNDAFNNLNSSCVINCEASEIPSGWDSNWNRTYQVVWGYTR